MWGSLLRAELQRRSRGGQVYRLRMAWALALYGILAGLYAAGTLALGLQASETGPFVLAQLRDGQLLIGCVIGAAMGAQAGVQDRLGGAMDLVALTRMGALQRWLERSLAHQLTLMSLVLLSGPALLACTALGGVTELEVLWVLLGSLQSVLLVSTVASALALVTDRALWAWLGAMAWGWLVLLAVPGALGTQSLRLKTTFEALFAHPTWPAQATELSPLWAGAIGETSADGLGLAVGLGLLLVVALRGGAELRRISGGRAWALNLGSLIGVVMMLLTASQHPLLAGRLGTATVLPEALVEPVLVVMLGMLALDGGLRLLRLRRMRRRRAVLGAWLEREWRSQAHGGVSVLGWWLAGVLGVLLLQGWWSLPTLSTRLDVLPWATAWAVLGLSVTVLSALLSTQQDRSQGSVLAGSPRGPRRLMRYRLLGVGARGLPFLMVAAALRDPWLMLWVPGFWLFLTTTTLAAGWGIRHPGQAFAVGLGQVFVFGVGLGQATLWGHTGARVQAVLAPMLAEGHVPVSWSVVSAVGYTAVGLLVWIAIEIRVRGWLARA